jgi:hypothetical protein
MMRQDPDIILVGEVRDAETAEMALRAAMTGHQVYSTLHTNSAIGAIPRLLDIGILPDIMAGNIIGIIAQRLVRRLCVHCKVPYQAEAHETRLLGNLAEGPRPVIYRPGGCERCEFQGYRGPPGDHGVAAHQRRHGRADRPPQHGPRNAPAGQPPGLHHPRRRRPAPRSRRIDLARGSRPRRRPDRPDVTPVPLYTYKAVSPEGRMVFGRIDAINLVDLEMRLRRMELDLVSGEPVSNRSLLRSGGVPRREIIHFCFHLQQLVRAGVPILEGLTDLRDSLEHPRFREVVASLIESIEGGQTLSQAMESHRRVFDQVFVSLIRAGETTGRLPEVLHSLNESLKWEDELASQTKKMIAYPAFVGTIVLAPPFS